MQHTDCTLLLTERAHVPLLADAGAQGVVAADRLFVVDSADGAWTDAIAPYAGAALPDVPVAPSDTFMLIFTSGTTGAPKAVKMGHGRLTGYGSRLAENFGLGPDDACYSVMPLFHSNAAVAGFTNIVASGAVAVLRRRFSASGWLGDVRRYGVTFFNYVGKPLTYVLATPEQPDDADNPLKFAFGNEAAPLDIDRFATRFGCFVVDGYCGPEARHQHEPHPRDTTGFARPARHRRCRRAHRRSRDRYRVSARQVRCRRPFPQCGGGDRRDRQRARRGRFRGLLQQRRSQRGTNARRQVLDRGLGYRDEEGFFYFAGRNSGWLRADGENFAARRSRTCWRAIPTSCSPRCSRCPRSTSVTT